MKKLIYLTLLFLTNFCFSQVGIGTDSPHASSILELKSDNKGLILPKVSTINRDLILNPAEGLLIFNTNENCIQQNKGTEAVPNWQCLVNDKPSLKSFYMPSINIDTSTIGNGQTFNLFESYKNQFENPVVKSTGSPSTIPFYSLATDLYYYITYFDSSIFANVSIDASGIMTYDVIASSTGCAFMTVLFVQK